MTIVWSPAGCTASIVPSTQASAPSISGAPDGDGRHPRPVNRDAGRAGERARQRLLVRRQDVHAEPAAGLDPRPRGRPVAHAERHQRRIERHRGERVHRHPHRPLVVDGGDDGDAGGEVAEDLAEPGLVDRVPRLVTARPSRDDQAVGGGDHLVDAQALARAAGDLEQPVDGVVVPVGVVVEEGQPLGARLPRHLHGVGGRAVAARPAPGRPLGVGVLGVVDQQVDAGGQLEHRLGHAGQVGRGLVVAHVGDAQAVPLDAVAVGGRPAVDDAADHHLGLPDGEVLVVGLVEAHRAQPLAGPDDVGHHPGERPLVGTGPVDVEPGTGLVDRGEAGQALHVTPVQVGQQGAAPEGTAETVDCRRERRQAGAEVEEHGLLAVHLQRHAGGAGAVAAVGRPRHRGDAASPVERDREHRVYQGTSGLPGGCEDSLSRLCCRRSAPLSSVPAPILGRCDSRTMLTRREATPRQGSRRTPSASSRTARPSATRPARPVGPDRRRRASRRPRPRRPAPPGPGGGRRRGGRGPGGRSRRRSTAGCLRRPNRRRGRATRGRRRPRRRWASSGQPAQHRLTDFPQTVAPMSIIAWFHAQPVALGHEPVGQGLGLRPLQAGGRRRHGPGPGRC